MFHYPNSIGMQYEAEVVMRCIQEGKLESDEYTLDETLRAMQICDEVRQQIGVKWPFEAAVAVGSCSSSNGYKL